MKFYIYCVVILLVFLTTCKPKKSNIFHGNISELITGNSLENVQVDIEVNKLNSGIISSYKLIGTSYTDKNGYFKMEFEAAQALSYRITLSKLGYHTSSYEITPNDITAEYIINKSIPREAFLEFHIQNVPFAYDDDILRYRILNSNSNCQICCGSNFHSFKGIIDTTTFCPLVGYDTITIEYYTYSNGTSNQFSEEVIVPAGDTIKKTMRY